jgi:hypothetical protein
MNDSFLKNGRHDKRAVRLALVVSGVVVGSPSGIVSCVRLNLNQVQASGAHVGGEDHHVAEINADANAALTPGLSTTAQPPNVRCILSFRFCAGNCLRRCALVLIATPFDPLLHCGYILITPYLERTAWNALSRSRFAPSRSQRHRHHDNPRTSRAVTTLIVHERHTQPVASMDLDIDMEEAVQEPLVEDTFRGNADDILVCSFSPWHLTSRFAPHNPFTDRCSLLPSGSNLTKPRNWAR